MAKGKSKKSSKKTTKKSPVKKSAALKKAQASGVKVGGKTYANSSSNAALTKARATSNSGSPSSSSNAASKASLLKTIESSTGATRDKAIAEYNKSYGASSGNSSTVKKYSTIVDGVKIYFSTIKEANDYLDNIENGPKEPAIEEENVDTALIATQAQLDSAYKIIDAALKKGDLTQAQADAYKKIVKEWDPNKLVNVENVLADYQKVADDTIDPYWQEQLNFETGVLQEAVRQQQRQQEMQNEIDRTTAGNNIRQSQAGLEKSGMTFTGEGIEQLGGTSAYSQGPSSGVPAQTPFGGLFHEGKVNQANRLMTSSTLAKYSDALTKLGQSAEERLGSKGVAGLVPGYTPTTNDLEGSLTTDWNQAKGQAFLNSMDYWNTKSQLNNPLVTIK